MRPNSFSRRDFLKLPGLGVGALPFNPCKPVFRTSYLLPQFPTGGSLGRVAVTPNFYSTELKARPDSSALAIRNVAQDEVVLWQRALVGTGAFGGSSKTWVETSEGYMYAPHLQPVRNLPNTPMANIPQGKPGFWAEVTVPYVDLQIQNAAIAPAVKYSLETNQPLRLYYSQVVWIDQIGADASASIFYRVNEAPGHGYVYGDIFLADGAGFRPLREEEVSPIHPDIDPNIKKIIIDATPGRQTLSCFEGNTEVYFCKISSGYGEKFSTPLGDQAVSWKIFSINVAASFGASDSGYDTMAVSWPTFFNTNAGAAIHGAFWHNDFGVRRSHGCINAAPEDAKWVFRWTAPVVSLDQSEIRLQWPNVSGSFTTSVTVSELQNSG